MFQEAKNNGNDYIKKTNKYTRNFDNYKLFDAKCYLSKYLQQ